MALMKTCCFCIAPRNGAIAIAAFYLTVNVIVLILAGFVVFTTNLLDPIQYIQLLLTFIVSWIHCAFIVLLLIGAIKGIPFLMLLWIIVEFIGQILFLFAFIALPFYSEVPSLAAYIVVGLIIIVVSFYFWLCIVSAREHVIEESRGRNYGNFIA